MFALKRNQVIITALVVMVAVAGYLNYIDSKSSVNQGITLNDQGEVVALVPDTQQSNEDILAQLSEMSDSLVMDEDTYISSDYGDITEASSITGETMTQASSDPGSAVFVSTVANNDSTYFVQAKLDREQVRAKQKEMLTEMINNTNIEQVQRAECANNLLEIQKRIEKESAAEAMIEAKGFKEVYVRIDDSTVDVVVNKEALTDAEIAQIEDIVKRKTGMAADQIRISTLKK